MELPSLEMKLKRKYLCRTSYKFGGTKRAQSNSGNAGRRHRRKHRMPR